jgi:hypothetical protein
VKTWLPADVRGTCNFVSDAPYGAAVEFLCDTNQIPDFTGHSIGLMYFSYRSEPEARLAYASRVFDRALGYDGGGTCPDVDSESGWVHGDGPREGRVLCTVTEGYAQIYQTFFGTPIMVNLYREGNRLDVLHTAWRANGGAIEPDVAGSSPAP